MGLCQILAIVLCPTEQKENRIHNGAEDNKERPYWPNSLCIMQSCISQVLYYSNESCTFSVFGQITQAVRAGLKFSAILLQYLLFEGGFSMFSWTKQITNQSFFTIYIVASALKSRLTFKKLSILALKCTFLGQNRLKHTKLILLGIYNFGSKYIFYVLHTGGPQNTCQKRYKTLCSTAHLCNLHICVF